MQIFPKNRLQTLLVLHPPSFPIMRIKAECPVWISWKHLLISINVQLTICWGWIRHLYRHLMSLCWMMNRDDCCSTSFNLSNDLSLCTVGSFPVFLPYSQIFLHHSLVRWSYILYTWHATFLANGDFSSVHYAYYCQIWHHTLYCSSGYVIQSRYRTCHFNMLQTILCILSPQ